MSVFVHVCALTYMLLCCASFALLLFVTMLGTVICVVRSRVSYVTAGNMMRGKGSDASNAHDEEVRILYV